ncbi:MAG: LytTR family DNA-binding domain-containing protein [Evtepia sp.]|nr:LytTR family DNA-binding domain-containing protein [Evtepia sp.]
MSEIEIIVNCPTVDTHVRNLLDVLQQCAVSLPGMVDDMSVCVPLYAILYIESIDRKIFFYDESRVFQRKDSLAALESLLEQYRFLRISKNCIVNIFQITATYRCDNHRLGILLRNGERLVAGRVYTSKVRKSIQQLGMSLSGTAQMLEHSWQERDT